VHRCTTGAPEPSAATPCSDGIRSANAAPSSLRLSNVKIVLRTDEDLVIVENLNNQSPGWRERLMQAPEIASIPGFADLALIQSGKRVADAARRFAVLDKGGRPIAFGLCSQPIAPNFVRRAVEHAACARAMLPEDLGAPVLLPDSLGTVDGCSFAVYPFLRTFSHSAAWRRLQLLRHRGAVMTWLHEIARATRTPADRSRVEAGCESLIGFAGISKLAKAVASAAAARVGSGAWAPATTLCHQDFWWGNVLPDPPVRGARLRFRVIDWGGSTPTGLPGLDLIRGLESFRFSAPLRRRHFQMHAAALACSSVELVFSIAAALGEMSIHLEHFPPQRFVEMADRCLGEAVELGGGTAMLRDFGQRREAFEAA